MKIGLVACRALGHDILWIPAHFLSRQLVEFAVASIRGWWRHEGRRLYPRTRTVLITADAGGSNGWRLRLWKLELQKFADQTVYAA